MRCFQTNGLEHHKYVQTYIPLKLHTFIFEQLKLEQSISKLKFRRHVHCLDMNAAFSYNGNCVFVIDFQNTRNYIGFTEYHEHIISKYHSNLKP